MVTRARAQKPSRGVPSSRRCRPHTRCTSPAGQKPMGGTIECLLPAEEGLDGRFRQERVARPGLEPAVERVEDEVSPAYSTSYRFAVHSRMHHPRQMPSRIEDYAVIGDCLSAALVGRDG